MDKTEKILKQFTPQRSNLSSIGGEPLELPNHSRGKAPESDKGLVNKKYVDDNFIQTETDPVFSAWLIATPPLYSESDPVFTAWDKSTGITIAESQVTNLTTDLGNKSDVGHTHDDRYYTETETNNLLSGKSDTSHNHALNNLSEKSYNSLTDKPTIPTALSQLSDDSTHRLVTDTEKSTWNGKQDALGYTPVANIVTKEDISTRTDSGFYQAETPTTAEGWPVDGSWYHLISSTHSNSANYYSMQFAGDFFNSNNIYYRATANSGTGAWYKLWHSGNDGTGSGLDADTLDGSHASAFQLALTSSSDVNVNTLTSTTYIQNYGEFYHRHNSYMLNKAESGWLAFLTRDTTGSETVVNLNYIGTEYANLIYTNNLKIGTGQQYVEKKSYTASNDILVQKTAEANVVSTSYSKVSEIRCGGTGTLRIVFDLQNLDATTTYGRIYKNGVAVGTERSVFDDAWTTQPTEDLAFVEGDLIQLYAKSATGTAFTRNFKVMGVQGSVYDFAVVS